MSDVTMQCLASLATGRALRTIDELCESQSRVGTWKLSTLVATARSELGECAFQLRKSHNALLAERDQLRAEADQFRELAKANGDALGKALAELEAIRGQQPDAVSVPRELLESHLQQVGEYSWDPDSVGMLRALLSTKNAEEV